MDKKYSLDLDCHHYWEVNCDGVTGVGVYATTLDGEYDSMSVVWHDGHLEESVHPDYDENVLKVAWCEGFFNFSTITIYFDTVRNYVDVYRDRYSRTRINVQMGGMAGRKKLFYPLVCGRGGEWSIMNQKSFPHSLEYECLRVMRLNGNIIDIPRAVRKLHDTMWFVR